MNWEAIKTFIDGITNNPTFIAVVSVLTASIPALVIFSNSSFGKKAIDKLTRLFNLGDQKADVTLKKVENVERLAKEKIEALAAQYAQKADELKSECEKKVAAAVSIFNYYEESLFAIVEEIPNAKVQVKVKTLKESYLKKKEEITATIGVIYQDYEEALESKKQEAREEYEEKIAYLENQIARLNLYFNEVKGEPNDGERRKEENTDSIEEEI